MWIDADGVHYFVDKHKSGCRCQCEDKGAVTKFVPFDRIQDVTLQEPAGAVPECCCVQQRLHHVGIQTAGASGAPEIDVWGIKDAIGFRNAVLQAKAEGPGRMTAGGVRAGAAKSKTSSILSAAGGGGNVEALLVENNTLLRKQLKLLEVIAKASQEKME
eukprot:CAMPEP_0185266384 /NCGR_PEP_ID=MMETSP1359-20130426/30895_1 /TAXON_ID=552665 /ORGANISM="Bigelowiella longifila, Strain CCMP242" /LENGTH=159 /DNA_ID=CAMNT_0027856171 /DNA_START=101 /DNA_END=580 /DNA_ORIENTATION=+